MAGEFRAVAESEHRLHDDTFKRPSTVDEHHLLRLEGNFEPHGDPRRPRLLHHNGYPQCTSAPIGVASIHVVAHDLPQKIIRLLFTVITSGLVGGFPFESAFTPSSSTS
jgi:hypothetical protein